MKRKSEIQSLRDQLETSKAEHQRTQRVAQVAMRDAMKSSDLLSGFAHAASAAEMFISAGDLFTGKRILSVLKTAHIDHLRERVSREPGGVNYDGSAELPRPDQVKP